MHWPPPTPEIYTQTMCWYHLCYKYRLWIFKYLYLASIFIHHSFAFVCYAMLAISVNIKASSLLGGMLVRSKILFLGNQLIGVNTSEQTVVVPASGTSVPDCEPITQRESPLARRCPSRRKTKSAWSAWFQNRLVLWEPFASLANILPRVSDSDNRSKRHSFLGGGWLPPYNHGDKRLMLP